MKFTYFYDHPERTTTIEREKKKSRRRIFSVAFKREKQNSSLRDLVMASSEIAKEFNSLKNDNP